MTKRLGLCLTVFHPDSMPPSYAGKADQGFQPRDNDGHYIGYQMIRFGGEALVEANIRRGVDARFAARILRKLADRIEAADQQGKKLTDLHEGGNGWFNADGSAEWVGFLQPPEEGGPPDEDTYKLE